jgi:glutamate-1-semialdehyde 2,1-aminomutase
MSSYNKILAVVQARMNSSRLPGKPLMSINGRTMLEQIISNLKACRTVDAICVATTSTEKDDEMVLFLENRDIPCFRGSEMDIAGRLTGAAKQFHADVLLRIWGDCPLIAPGVIDDLVETFEEEKADFATNSEPPTFPFGMNAEIYRTGTLEKIIRSTDDPFYREYPIEFVKDNSGFVMVNHSNIRNVSDIKLTVDYPEDAEVVNRIMCDLGIDDNNAPGLDSIVEYCRKAPSIFDKCRGLPRNVEYKDDLKARGRKSTG